MDRHSSLPLYYGFPSNYVLEKERRRCVTGFIENIWNNHRLDMLPHYLHPDFVDHNLPRGLQNAAGLSAYLEELRENISHHTTIEKLIPDRDFVVVKVKIILSCLVNPLLDQYRYHQDETITGYRILALCDQRIIGHWELFDPE